MHATLSQLLAPLDRETIARERDELREQLEDCEALLRLIDRHNCNGHECGGSAAASAGTAAQSIESSGPANGNGGDHAPLTRKRDTVLAILRENPGRWQNSEMRAALAQRGIDPHAGTPVKNIMWKLAKDGILHASGNGVYEFPVLSVSAIGEDEQGAMGL
ncbi:MAG: hypothetical protein QOI48_1009 [Solirubrobacteraceae bacterium]|jgi:hypothetical protein|nr:hypothetical protein [Solirubrobacteraceae bacterium]